MLEAIGDAVSGTVLSVLEAMERHPEFRDVGKRMIVAWQEGVNGLRDNRVYASGDWPKGSAFADISEASKLKTIRAVVGRSPLLGDPSGRTKRA